MPIQKILLVDEPSAGLDPITADDVDDLLLGLKQDGRTTLIIVTHNIQSAKRLGEDKPDLILMDVVMPGQNGFQLTRAITRDPRFVNVPVIMCTSKNQETDKVWGMRQGARDYIVKPVDPTELMAKIHAFD